LGIECRVIDKSACEHPDVVFNERRHDFWPRIFLLDDGDEVIRYLGGDVIYVSTAPNCSNTVYKADLLVLSLAHNDRYLPPL
jgi:hypothetical protein